MESLYVNFKINVCNLQCEKHLTFKNLDGICYNNFYFYLYVLKILVIHILLNFNSNYLNLNHYFTFHFFSFTIILKN